MDDIDLRLLTLERAVLRLRQQIASTNQRLLANLTVLNNSGPSAGAATSGGSGSTGGQTGGQCMGDSIVGGLPALPSACPNGDNAVAICPNSSIQVPCQNTTATAQIFNSFSTSVPANTTIYIQPAFSQVYPNAYMVTRVG